MRDICAAASPISISAAPEEAQCIAGSFGTVAMEAWKIRSSFLLSKVAAAAEAAAISSDGSVRG